MAKSEPTIEERANLAIKEIRADMVSIKYKLLNEILVKAAKHNGEIPPGDLEFQQQKETLLNSDPDAPGNRGKPVISMLSFEKGSKEKTDKLIAKGASKELFDSIAQETVALRNELTSKFYSDQGITDLMSDLMIHKAVEVTPFQVRITKQEGMYKPGDTRSMNNMEVAELGALISPGMVMSPGVTHYLMANGNAVDKVIGPVVSARVAEFFGEKGADGATTLDKRKLTAENIEAFTTAVNADIEKIPAQNIILNAITALEKENGYTISKSQTQRIVNKLTPALVELGPEYLKQYSEVISGQIQKEVVAKSMVTASALGGIYIREGNLDKIANNLSDTHLDRSDKRQIEKIEGSLRSQALKDSQIAEKLTELEVEKAKASRYDVNKLSDRDLAQMRKENPVQFDKIVLGRDNPVKEPKAAIIDGIIKGAIDKLKEENGVKLTPEREDYLKKKFKKELSPALSKLDPEYLKTHSQTISSDIQKELYENKSTGYRFGMAFSVSTESLSFISDGITAKNQQRSNELVISTIRSALTTSYPSNTEFEGRLTNLAVEKAKATKFKAAAITSEDLLAMRKENPARFDKVVLGVGKERTPIDLAKDIGEKVNKAKQGQALPHPSTSRTSSPSLSKRSSTSSILSM
ncbi:MAG: hypothetical protein LF888_01485 [Candidatus Megaira endosymbiont of Mesostigma viride]|nr:MAG: hypothetical protein LF888_01485 [Candidatus Megaira endosymbiont of Mesostigma viride]HJK88563.1 hypothetical protein [Candidatus Megaira endosymbiont of Mesostigma viride]